VPRERFARLCVFCGSQSGARAIYADAASALGRSLLRHGIGLVYGGGAVGLMGILADTLLAGEGEVIGVIPRPLGSKEVAHQGLKDLRYVDSMHQRKAQMAELADGFIAMPGGFGTFEEFFEVLTWAQLGIHGKPCGLLNAEGYFDGLIAFIDHAVAEGFVRPKYRPMVLLDSDPEALIQRMQSYEPPARGMWIRPDQT
jgi:uncharacterized protein (TIGR00730 family)